MILQPIADNVVIKIIKSEDNDFTKSGIYIPKSAQSARPNKGVVVAVGEGRISNNGERIKPVVKEGDSIIFNEFAGTKISANDEEYLVIKENDIIVKFS